jgi:hypothetical protein
MKTELTTPKAILIGMSLIAVAIASIPYSKSVVTEAHAANGVQKVTICDEIGTRCGANFRVWTSD